MSSVEWHCRNAYDELAQIARSESPYIAARARILLGQVEKLAQDAGGSAVAGFPHELVLSPM